MNRQELLNLIYKTDRENQKRKKKRMIKSYLLFTILISLFLFGILRWSPLESIGVGLLASGPYLLINLLIFNQIISASDAENAYLDNLIKKYREDYGENVML